MKKLSHIADRIENHTVVIAVAFFLLGALGDYLVFRQRIDPEMKEALFTAMFGLPAVAIGAFLAFRLEADRVHRVERRESFRKAALAHANLILMGNRVCNMLIDRIGPAQEAVAKGVPKYLSIPAILPIDSGSLDVSPESLAFLLDAEKDDLLALITVAVSKYKGYALEIDARSKIWLEQLKPARMGSCKNDARMGSGSLIRARRCIYGVRSLTARSMRQY